MTEARLKEILSRFPELTVLSVGDFFLDRYWMIDPQLAEVSLETGLTANQVVALRRAPGGAGTVAKNLCALSVGRTIALSVIGDDGEGSDLMRSLQDLGADTSLMIVSPDRVSPAYTKPMSCEGGTPREWERFDIKNRTPTSSELESRVIEAVHSAVAGANAVVVSDQVEEQDCGVITQIVREELSSVASQNPDVVFLADSRARIGSFAAMRTKPNRREALCAVGMEVDVPSPAQMARAAQFVYLKTGWPVFVTCGREGIFVHTGQKSGMAGGFEVKGRMDPVGAGDNAMAAIAASLAAGADDFEAALIGNLAAAVTVRKIGETGSSTPDEILDLFRSTPR